MEFVVQTEEEEGVTSFQTNDHGSSLKNASSVKFNGESSEPPAAMDVRSILKSSVGFEDTDAYSRPDDVHCLPSMFENEDEVEGDVRHADAAERDRVSPSANHVLNENVEFPATDVAEDYLAQVRSDHDNRSHNQPVLVSFPSGQAQDDEMKSADASSKNDEEVVSSPHSILQFQKLRRSIQKDLESANGQMQDKRGNNEERVTAEISDKLNKLPQATTHVRPSLSERSHDRSKRPGVILLGRGNSFSLGRSEVILLHGSKETQRKKNADVNSNSNNNNNNNNNSISDSDKDSKLNGFGEDNHSDSIKLVDVASDVGFVSNPSRTGASTNGVDSKEISSDKSELSAHPPALSNQLVQPNSSDNSHDLTPRAIRITSSQPVRLLNGTSRKNGERNGTLSNSCRFDTATELGDELEQLWRKTEVIMFQKRSVVEKVLEDFGISNVGGEADAEGRGGDRCSEEDFDVDDEEESVWQAVQNNFR